MQLIFTSVSGVASPQKVSRVGRPSRVRVETLAQTAKKRFDTTWTLSRHGVGQQAVLGVKLIDPAKRSQQIGPTRHCTAW